MSRLQNKIALITGASEAEYPALSQAGALNLDWDFLLALRDAGRQAADRLDREVWKGLG